MDSISDFSLNRRMIVLVPEGLSATSDLAKKVYWMALRDHCDVVYLGFVYDEEKKLSVMRNIATLKALTTGETVRVSSRLTSSDAWNSTLQDMLRPGDIIVCHDEQFIRNGLFSSVTIRDMLASTYKGPIYSMNGFYHPWVVLTRKWLWGIVFWAGCLAILAGFSFLEIQVDQTVQGLSKAVLIGVILAFEFSAFWAWNHIPKI
jgi:hypothetical protein